MTLKIVTSNPILHAAVGLPNPQSRQSPAAEVDKIFNRALHTIKKVPNIDISTRPPRASHPPQDLNYHPSNSPPQLHSDYPADVPVHRHSHHSYMPDMSARGPSLEAEKTAHELYEERPVKGLGSYQEGVNRAI